jgi:hypothetical protein
MYLGEVVYIGDLDIFKMSSRRPHTRIWVLYRLSGCERSKTEFQEGRTSQKLEGDFRVIVTAAGAYNVAGNYLCGVSDYGTK